MKRWKMTLGLAWFAFESVMFLSGSSAVASGACLTGTIKHVVYIVFDNVHYRRDNVNVPSDLEQIPHLKSFIQTNGTLDTNHHTPLISHTANDILTSLTGVYPDRHGIAVANSYGVFEPSKNFVDFPSSFFYWTDLVNDVNSFTGDFRFGMLTESGKNAPAPWVPFTRAGCDVGAWAVANMEVERPSFDVPKIFGAGSPEAMEDSDHQEADFEGVAVHCAKTSALCSAVNHGIADLLPQEPGGYNGFNALFGAKYAAPALLGPGKAFKDLDGNVITNPFSGLTGFTGFDPTPSQSLGVVAEMLENGVPVVFAYIEDAHDNHVSDMPFGPGEAGYVAQLKSFDDAFGAFFSRLAMDGLDKSNTLFIFTSDEGDHFSGGAPSPMNCNGGTTPCTYTQIGELDLNLGNLVAAQDPSFPGAFDIHFDLAPTVYIHGAPGPTDAITRRLEHDIAALTAMNPLTGVMDVLTAAMADPVEMGMLHMITDDPARTPSFTMFSSPDYFYLTGDFPAGTSPVLDCGFAWNHGGIQPEITTTWLGLVGPGVGVGADVTFSDHTDTRPTILALLGMQDDYVHDGRVLFEAIDPLALPASLTVNSATLLQLAQIYKQINAPLGQLGMDSLNVSTFALESMSPKDAAFNTLEGKLDHWRKQRDSLADKMKTMLDAAEFHGDSVPEQQAQHLISEAQTLLAEVSNCAADLPLCVL